MCYNVKKLIYSAFWRCDMEINNVGYKFVHGGKFSINRPRGSGDYAILFLRTEAIFTLRGADIQADAQSFILYKKGTPQFFRANGESFVNDWVHFSLDGEEENRITEMGIPFDTPVRIGDISFFSKIVKSMYQEKYSANPLKDETLNLYMELIFIKLAEALRFPSSEKHNPHYGKIAEIRAKIFNDPAAEWTVDAIAETLALSRSYFQHLYKRFFGTNISSDIISARIERAQYLLSSTDYGVAYIARECGYKNDVHFMRQFKKEVGITPTEFRKENGTLLNSKYKDEQKAPYFIPHTT